MKKNLEIVTACLVMVMSLIGCGGGGGSSSTNTGTDAIAITNISPASAAANASTVFSVDVSYTLASKNGGELAVGFNTNPSQPGSFYLDSTQKFLVTKGSGTHTFVSTATPVAGTFMVSVDLSENPHPTPWSPLASDMRTIGK